MASQKYEVLLAEHEELLIAIGDEIREIEVNGEWAVIEIINKGFIATWYDQTWMARNGLLTSADDAKDYAAWRAKRVSRRFRLQKICNTAIDIISIVLVLYSIAVFVQHYGG